MLSLGRFLVGTAACGAVVGVLAYGSLQVRRAVLPSWRGPRARLAEIVIAMAVFFAVEQVLGAVHLFSSIAVLVGELLAGALLAAVGRSRASAPSRGSGAHQGDEIVTPVPTRASKGEVAVAIAAAGIVVVQWAAHIAFTLGRGMTHPDTLWYHGPFAATFVQRHTFTGIDSLGYDVARWFPFNAHLVHASGILAYGHDILTPFVHLGWMLFALLGAWCLGARRGVSHLSLLGASVVFGLPIMVATQPGQASSDVACGALLLAAVTLLVESDFGLAPVTLAGLAAGLALSTKISIAAPIAYLVVSVPVLAYAHRRRLAALGWAVAFAATGTFWFLRDWVLSGTPLPWFNVSLGPIHLPQQVQSDGPALASDVLVARAWRDLYLDGIWQGLGRTWPLVVALLIAAAVIAIARGTLLQRAVGALIVVGVVGFVYTPLTGGFGFVYNLRYLGPVLLVAFALLPTVLPEKRSWSAGAVAVLAVVFLADLTMPNRESIPAWPAGRVLPAALVIVVGAGMVYLATQRRRALIALAGVALVGFWIAQRYYVEHRYVAAGLREDRVNEFFRDVHDARVVVFGSDESYPMFGLDLSNRVGRGDQPPVDVGTDPCRGWRSSLADRADYVVMSVYAFGYFEKPPDAVIADDPAAHLVLDDGNNQIYRITGAFSPDRCPT